MTERVTFRKGEHGDYFMPAADASVPAIEPVDPRTLTVQPCCGKTHGLPFQHIKVYQDKHGRTKHLNECARCFLTRHLEGRKEVRWSKPGSPHCEQCEQEEQAAQNEYRQLALAGITQGRAK